MAASLALGQQGVEEVLQWAKLFHILLAVSGAWFPQCVQQGPALPGELVSSMVQAEW